MINISIFLLSVAIIFMLGNLYYMRKLIIDVINRTDYQDINLSLNGLKFYVDNERKENKEKLDQMHQDLNKFFSIWKTDTQALSKREAVPAINKTQKKIIKKTQNKIKKKILTIAEITPEQREKRRAANRATYHRWREKQRQANTGTPDAATQIKNILNRS